MKNEGLRTWIEISKKALKNNYSIFRKLIGPKCQLMAVVKSNAYGHSLVDFSRLVGDFGVDWLGVDSIVEAESLRREGIKKPVLVLGYTLLGKVEEATKNNVSLTVADLETLRNLRNFGRDGKKLKIHLKIDTGMHRQGFFVSEIPEVIKILKSKPNIKLEGVYTHFSSAKDLASPSETLEQIEEFKKAIGLLESAGFKNFIKHASATAGAILFPESHFDMVRIGIGLYGLWPSKEIKNAFKNKIKLEPVLSWKTIVGQIRKIPKGSGIGYDLTEKITRNSMIAVLPIGYWHGFPRLLSSVGSVLVRGNKMRVLGRVSMDMVCINVTSVKSVKVGDDVILIGKSGKFEISADDIADLSGTTSYEIITRINPLIKRIIV